LHPAEIGGDIKTESRSWGKSQSPKAGQVVDPGADLWDRGKHSKLNSNLIGGGADQTELLLKGNTAATWKKQQL
jgi:hypothetical protein